jgi:G3E family GTPase
MLTELAAGVPGGLPTVVALLVVTLLAANGVAAALERARAGRIADKTARLAAAPPPRGAAAAGPVPVTLLVGWLGAGKTTLLNRLLAAPQGRRLCVIENEAGSISIDHALLQAPPDGGGEGGRAALPPGGVVVLKNGCLCCSAGGTGDELERVLDRLLALQEEVVGPDGQHQPRRQFDHVVIEASGLADPAPLVSTFFGSRQLGRRYALDSVVAVVDAKHIGRHLDGRGLLPRTRDAGRQVAYADTVVLTKSDVATPAEAAAAVAAITAVNPTARLLVTTTATHGDIDTADLLGRRAFDVSRARELLLAQQARSAGAPGAPVTAAHDRDIRAVTVPLPHPVDQRRLQGWLQRLVSQQWQDLFRVKGIVWVTAGDGDGAGGSSGDGGTAKSPRSGRRRSVAAADATAGPAGGARLLVIQGVHAELHASFVPAPPPSTQAAPSTRRAGSPSSARRRKAAAAASAAPFAAHSDTRQHHHNHSHECSAAGCDARGHHDGNTPLPPPDELTTALVLIGRRLDEREILASLAAAGLLDGGRI